MKLDFPSSNRESKPEAPKKSVWDKVKESRLAKTLIVAGALHAPVANETAAKGVQSAVEAIRGSWHMPNMVLEPQSVEEQHSIQERVASRKSKIDPIALETYKKEAEKKIDAGEHVSFKRMQFDLERLNGMSAEEVVSAEKKADALIEKYSHMIGDELDEKEITQISTEMYGPDAAYTWGQASAVRYFNGGERNCVGVARAQGIVMEGILEKLPPEKRAQWHQATQMVKQHEMAALEHIGADGQRDALYILEGKATRNWKDLQEEPGTATIPMKAITKAMVSTKPVEVKAAGTPGEVSDSPDIRLIADEPVSLNLNIKGKLKGSESVMVEAKREGLKPRKMTNEEMAAQEERLHATEKIVEFDILPQQENDKNPHNIANVSDMSVTEIRTFLRSPIQADQVYRELRVPDGHLSAAFIKEYVKLAHEDKINLQTIKLFSSGAYGASVSPETVQILLLAKGQQIIDISDFQLRDATRISKLIGDMSEDKTVYIDGSDIFVRPLGETESKESRLVYEQLSKTKGIVRVSVSTYDSLIRTYPELLNNRHVEFDIANSGLPELYDLLKTINKISPSHDLYRFVYDVISSREADAKKP